MENKPDYDALFAQSQQSRFQKPSSEQGARFDDLYRQGYAKKQKQRGKSPVTPEVLDATGRPMRPARSGLSPELCGVISIAAAALALILVFVGMFFHLLLWLNILLCLVGIGFGVAAVIKGSVGRLFGIIGIAACLFMLLVTVICLIVTAVISGASALFKLMS